jgi:DNA-damage-inducible protein J
MSSPQTSTIQLRIDSRTKAKAQSVLKELGTDLSSAMKLFLTQVIRTKSIPFIARTENGYTPEYERMILDELKAMKSGQELAFRSAYV